MQNDRERLTSSIENAKKLYAGDVTDLTETEYVAECLLSEGVVPVVPVVRCKDCKHLMFSDCYGECSRGYMRIVSPLDYCSRGERKDK